MRRIAALALAAAAAPVLAQEAKAPPSPGEIIQSAPAADWRDIPEGDLLVMEAAGGGRVVIQLAADFAPTHVANIRKLAAARWWDGTSINRVQDNYVVQWGDATEKKPLPAGIAAQPADGYVRPAATLSPEWIA